MIWQHKRTHSHSQEWQAVWIVFRKMRVAHFDLCRTKWKRGEYVGSWVTVLDSSIIRKIAVGEAVKCTAVTLLRAQSYDGGTHRQMRGHLKKGAVARQRWNWRDLMQTCTDNSESVAKHVWDTNTYMHVHANYVYQKYNRLLWASWRTVVRLQNDTTEYWITL